MDDNNKDYILKKGDKVRIVLFGEKDSAAKRPDSIHLKTGHVYGCCSLAAVPPEDRLYAIRLDTGYTKPSYYSPNVFDTKYVAIVSRSDLQLLDVDFIPPSYTAKRCFGCGDRCFSSISPVIALDTDGVTICENCSDKFHLSSKDGKVVAEV